MAVSKVAVRWPSGLVEHVSLPGVDRFYAIEEGKGVVASVCESITQDSGGAQTTTGAAR